MHRGLALALFGSLALGATCEKKIARPPVEEVPIRDPSETAPPPPPASAAKPAKDKIDKAPDKTADKADKLPPDPPGAMASTSPLLPATREDPPEAPRDKAFPKQADACKKDDDCATTNLALGGDSLCCSPCKPLAGTKAWVKRVEQVCQQKIKSGLKTHCAPLDCPKPDVECRAGKCVVK